MKKTFKLGTTIWTYLKESWLQKSVYNCPDISESLFEEELLAMGATPIEDEAPQKIEKTFVDVDGRSVEYCLVDLQDQIHTIIDYLNKGQ